MSTRQKKLSIFWIFFLAVFLVLLFSSSSFAWNYPRDGRFKQLSPRNDRWYFVDQRWDMPAPDKWQHFTGSYVICKLMSKKMNPYLSAGIVMVIGGLKEWEDAYREGWSARDMFVNFLGVSAALFNNHKYKLLCLYDQEKITLNLFLNFEP